MIFELPELPYEYSALEPHIDARTMEIHFTKHHAGYVKKLNTALEGCEKFASWSLGDILSDISVLPEEIRQAVRNSGGGHLNHSLFWQIMGPKRGGQPTGSIGEAIGSTFGEFGRFQEEFTKAALSRFGSGWTWLCMGEQDRLEVTTTANQDSPLMYGLKPILGLDVWEHAYYLKYQNRRDEYIKAWWNVVNWEKVGELYEMHRKLITAAK